MPDTFRFKQPPEWLQNHTLVLVCVEDFECLLRLAERWLNSEAQVSREICPCRVKQMSEEMMSQETVKDEQKVMLLESMPPDNKPLSVEQSNLQMQQSEEGSMLGQLMGISHILNGVAGQKLGKSPLDFLSKELSKFTSAKKIFSTEILLPKTAVASEFHKACDNVPNVLVIIKSGQYIAGGYTEVPFESRSRITNTGFHYKPNPKLSTFLFSVNKQKLYPLKNKERALNCWENRGPSFGAWGLSIGDDYMEKMTCTDYLHKTDSSFYSPTNSKGELFGLTQFSVDEYEVYKLE